MRTSLSHDKERGQVMLVIMLFLLGGSMLIVAGIVAVVQSQTRVLTERAFAMQVYAAAEGALEDVVYRTIHSIDVDSSETITIGDVPVTTVSTPIVDGLEITAEGDLINRIRAVRATLAIGSGASFSFGVQAGNGGFVLENSSSVSGNVFSNGSIVGAGLNLITGTAIAASPSGLVDNIHATGSVYAHQIQDSYINDDAYYQSIDIGTVVNGTKYPGSTDIATTSFPIQDSTIATWEAYASSSGNMQAECTAGGGTITFDSDVSLGPVKIPCNVKFEKFPDVTIDGAIWILGDLSFKQSPTFTINPAIGNKSVPIIVDNPSNRLTSSRITMDNSGQWTGNGNRSYVLVVSGNTSAEQGGTEKAITIENSTGGSVLVYSNHGEIQLRNNTDLTMITAWRVRLQNSTEVNYDTGIASTLFETGPGGGYTLDTWSEVE